MVSRRGDYFFHWWVEIAALILVGVGFFVGMLITNIWIEYAFMVVGGMVFGMFLYRERAEHFAPFVMISIAFILGFVIGNTTGDDLTYVLVYAGSLVFAYRLYTLFSKDDD